MIYFCKYKVGYDSQTLSQKLSIFRKYFSMGPKLTIFLINLALFLTLIVIGYGILFGISVECKI